MSRSNSSTSPEEILQKLLEQARANWGEERAQESWQPWRAPPGSYQRCPAICLIRKPNRDFINNDATGSQYCQ